MRVVAGDLGGRRLSAPRGSEVRPTSDRVREALFSILGDVGGCATLDLFCGTGALGIEALSRGADRATFVDRSVEAVERNVRELGLEERAEVVRDDALRFLQRDGPAFDLILLDPPYRLARRLAPELDRLLPRRMGQDSRVIVETASTEPLELPSLELADERSYGGTLLRIHRGAR